MQMNEQRTTTRAVYAVVGDPESVFWDFEVGGMCANNPNRAWASFQPVAIVNIGTLTVHHLNVMDIVHLGAVPEGARILWLAD